MTLGTNDRPIEIQLVEVIPGDVELAQRVLKNSKFSLNIAVAEDGEVATAYLLREGKFANAPRPDLILLDLAMPKKDGYQVLAEMNADLELKSIPVTILTATQSERDRLYFDNLHPNRYCNKPIDLNLFDLVVRGLTNSSGVPLDK